MSVAWVGVAASVLGGAMSSRSSKKASKAQSASADAASQAQLTASRDSNALQSRIYDQNRLDSAPWANTGEGALNQLAWRMGITPTNTINRETSNGVDWRDAPTSDTPGGSENPLWERIVAKQWAEHSARYGVGWDTRKTSAAERANNMASLRSQYNSSKASDPELAAYGAKIDAANAKNAPVAYKGDEADRGSLMRRFTMADRDADPVYQSGLQFGLDQGNQGIERQAAASGSQLSGATLKALARYGSDYGETKAQGAYERFGTDQNTQFNRLSGIAGTGQQTVNQLGSAGQNFANQVGANTIGAANSVGSNLIGAGNARASGYLSQGQAWGNALNSGMNAWQQNRAMNNLYTGSGTQAPAPVERRTY